MMSRISVLGAGGWGIGLALVASRMKHQVTLWSFDPSELEDLRLHNQNRTRLPGVFLPHGMALTGDMAVAADADMIIMAVPSFAIRSTAKSLATHLRPGTVVVNAGKGLEDGSLSRFSQVLSEELPTARVVVLSGPSHAEEVARGIPTAVVVASAHRHAAELTQDLFMNDHFRIYTSSDITGVEVGGAMKNVIALCAGCCDGMGLGDNTKAMLMTRGITEIARLGVALGGHAETFTGLAGLGDLIVTCTSMHSRNCRAGNKIGQGIPVSEAVSGKDGSVVEGYYAAGGARELAVRTGVEMPITEGAYEVLYEGGDPAIVLTRLMSRKKRQEPESEQSWI